MSDMTLAAYLSLSSEVIQTTISHLGEEPMSKAIELCLNALQNNKPILVCGNGGSASDAMHITGELVGRFLKERKALKCICLSDNPATITAWANDYDYETVFSRQVEAYGEKGAVLLAISTSGNSKNVLQAAIKAKDMGMSIIGFTGRGGAKLGTLCDVLLDAPCAHTPLVQQIHICLYHYLCEEIESHMAEFQSREHGAI